MIKQKIPVSVIIVSYNTCELTKSAIQALYSSSVLPNQIIVVDNSSSDQSVEMINREFGEVLLLKNKENLGFAKANNLAIRQYVDQPYVWLLNSDTETGRESLKDVYEFMLANPAVAGVGPTLVYPDGSNQSVGGYFPDILNTLLYLLPLAYFFPESIKKRMRTISLYPQDIPSSGLSLDYITGAAAFFRKEVLDKVGLLGEEYFMYFEETDLCWRIKKTGFELKVIQTDPVMHVYGGSYKKKHDPQRLSVFLNSFSIFVKKNYSGFKKYIILLEIFFFGRFSVFLKSLKK